MNTQEIALFHPLYQELIELGFTPFMPQMLVRDDARLELILSSYEQTYIPEYGGKFLDVTTFQNENGHTHQVDLDTLTLHLAFIGVNENLQKKRIGTKLLSDLCQIVDRYNLRMQLEIDDKFGVPQEKLRHWYTQFGFIYLYENNMVRLSYTERLGKLIPVKEIDKTFFNKAAKEYELHSKNSDFDTFSRNEFAYTAERLKKYTEVEYWGYDDLYWIMEMINDRLDIEDEQLTKTNAWAKEMFEWSKKDR